MSCNVMYIVESSDCLTCEGIPPRTLNVDGCVGGTFFVIGVNSAQQNLSKSKDKAKSNQTC